MKKGNEVNTGLMWLVVLLVASNVVISIILLINNLALSGIVLGPGGGFGNEPYPDYSLSTGELCGVTNACVPGKCPVTREDYSLDNIFCCPVDVPSRSGDILECPVGALLEGQIYDCVPNPCN